MVDYEFAENARNFNNNTGKIQENVTSAPLKSNINVYFKLLDMINNGVDGQPFQQDAIASMYETSFKLTATKGNIPYKHFVTSVW